MELDAKKRFCAGPHAKGWSDTTATEMFEEAAHAALATMQSSQVAADTSAASANYWRMEGARQFLATLTHLTDAQPQRAKPIRPQNLNHAT